MVPPNTIFSKYASVVLESYQSNLQLSTSKFYFTKQDGWKSLSINAIILKKKDVLYILDDSNILFSLLNVNAVL